MEKTEKTDNEWIESVFTPKKNWWYSTAVAWLTRHGFRLSHHADFDNEPDGEFREEWELKQRAEKSKAYLDITAQLNVNFPDKTTEGCRIYIEWGRIESGGNTLRVGSEWSKRDKSVKKALLSLKKEIGAWHRLYKK